MAAIANGTFAAGSKRPKSCRVCTSRSSFPNALYAKISGLIEGDYPAGDTRGRVSALAPSTMGCLRARRLATRSPAQGTIATVAKSETIFKRGKIDRL